MGKLKRILKSFSIPILSVFRCLSLFLLGGRFDNLETVIEGWCDSLNGNVSGSLDSILLWRDNVFCE